MSGTEMSAWPTVRCTFFREDDDDWMVSLKLLTPGPLVGDVVYLSDHGDFRVISRRWLPASPGSVHHRENPAFTMMDVVVEPVR